MDLAVRHIALLCVHSFLRRYAVYYIHTYTYECMHIQTTAVQPQCAPVRAALSGAGGMDTS